MLELGGWFSFDRLQLADPGFDEVLNIDDGVHIQNVVYGGSSVLKTSICDVP